VNVHITLTQIFFVFTVGVVAATITPTPGGLGGAEASLVLAFTSIGVSPQQALAATLSYRLITYWLPILPGVVVFQICRQKQLI
jgi:undecaprenyl-diphosphatase